MSKKLYVGNLAYSVTEDTLRSLFETYQPQSVSLITDKFTGRSKGFGFVEISDDSQADQAIEAMNGKDVEGRALTVNEARPLVPRGERSGGGFGGGRRDGGGGRGGFGGGRGREGGGGRGGRDGGGGGRGRW